jgi:hypothetical protein
MRVTTTTEGAAVAMQGMRSAVLGFLAIAGLTSCMTVNIDSRDAPVQVVRHAGVLRISVASPEQAVVGSVTGVGVAGTPMGWTAGFTRQRWAAIGPECRAVIFLDPNAELGDAARRALAEVSGACLLADRPTTINPTKERAQ